jgi:hypothetical protein
MQQPEHVDHRSELKVIDQPDLLEASLFLLEQIQILLREVHAVYQSPGEPP